ncbi:MAG: glutathione S-transferase family protein [Pseudomonadota bacterium]
MNPITIWGRTTSSNVMKVLWLCEELGLPFERIDAGGAFGRTKDADYLAMNPNATIPTIVEADGFSLWESNSILRYLCTTRAPGNALYPTEPRARADVDRWMDWQLASVNAPMVTIFFTYIRTPEDKRDWPATHAARDRAEALWRMVEARVSKHAFIAGDDLTIADIALGPYLHRWFALPIDRPPMPAVEAWHARLAARTGYAKYLAVPMS